MYLDVIVAAAIDEKLDLVKLYPHIVHMPVGKMEHYMERMIMILHGVVCETIERTEDIKYSKDNFIMLKNKIVSDIILLTPADPANVREMLMNFADDVIGCCQTYVVNYKPPNIYNINTRVDMST